MWIKRKTKGLKGYGKGLQLYQRKGNFVESVESVFEGFEMDYFVSE